MMETFIVLGLCFILYEALDLFQSCYNNNRHHTHHLGEAFNKYKSCDLDGSGNSSKDTTRLILDAIPEATDDTLSSGNECSSNNVDDDDGDGNQSLLARVHLDKPVVKVFSISESLDCSRIAG